MLFINNFEALYEQLGMQWYVYQVVQNKGK